MIAKNLQDKYLNELVANKKIVEVNLINGLILICKIEKFDNFSLQINYNKSTTLVYKHAISYISLKNFKKK
jgi:RNA chaperone Hfq